MKIQLVLALYDCLICGEKVIRKTFCAQNNISERTFYRYMSEIGHFLMHNKDGMFLSVKDPLGEYFIERNPGN